MRRLATFLTGALLLMAFASAPASAAVQIDTLTGTCVQNGQVVGTFIATPANPPTFVLIDEDTTHVQSTLVGTCTIDGVEYPFSFAVIGPNSYYHDCSVGTFLLMVHPEVLVFDLNGVTTELNPTQTLSFLYTADDEKERKAVCKSNEKVNKVNNPATDAEINENLTELIALLS
jgi:hypothetical protein